MCDIFLNYDCWLNIVEYLNIHSLKKLSKCNKFLYNVAKNKLDKYTMEDVINVYKKIKVYKNVCLEIGFYNIKTRSDIIRNMNNKMRVATFELFNIKKLIEMCRDDYYKIVYYRSEDKMINYYKIFFICEKTYDTCNINNDWNYEMYDNLSNNSRWYSSSGVGEW